MAPWVRSTMIAAKLRPLPQRHHPRRGMAGPGSWALLMIIAVVVASILLPRGGLAITYPLVQEQVAIGSPGGIAGVVAMDGLSEQMREASSATNPTSYPVAQTVGPGLLLSGVFPTYLQDADNLYLRYTETSTNMPTQSQRNPTSAGTVCQWANCNRGTTLNGQYATSNTNGLVATYGNFGFTVPTGATILSVEVGYDAFESSGNDQMNVTISWDQGATYCSNAATVSLPTTNPAAYTYVNMTNCANHAWSQADFTGTNILTKFTYVLVGGGTISLDANVVRVTYITPGNYELSVRYDFSGVPQGENYTLTVVGAISDENMSLQVLTPPSTWATRGTLNQTSNQVLSYRPIPQEMIQGNLSIRLVDALGPDPIQSDLWIGQVKLVTTVVASADLGPWIYALVGMVAGALLIFLYLFWWRRRSPEGSVAGRRGAGPRGPFSPRTPRLGLALGRWVRGPKSTPPPGAPRVGLKPGHAYLVEEEKPYQSLNILGDLTRTGKPGLLITRKNPKNLSGDFDLVDTKTYWLAEAKAPEGSQILTPSLETVLYTIDRFLKENSQGVVLLDGIEFLVDSNNFNSVLRFLRRTVDLVSQNEQILLVSVGPDTLQQRELRNLQREMDVIRLA